MSFVLQTVAGLLRGSQSLDSRDSCSGRCCHKADSFLARNSFSTSFECMNDDLYD